MKNKNAGFVYILTNPSFREDWVKIGKSERPVDIRSKELDNTAVPLPFEIFATMETAKFNEVEKSVHKMIDQLINCRIRKNREFFNIKPETALDILRNIAGTIDDAVIRTKTEDAPAKHKPRKPTPIRKLPAARPPIKTKKPRFKFSMIGIKPGAKIRFEPTGVEVVVASDDSVKYKGRLHKLSPFVKEFLPKKLQNSSGAYQGANYFSYKGKILTDLRKATERKKS